MAGHRCELDQPAHAVPRFEPVKDGLIDAIAAGGLLGKADDVRLIF